MSYARLIRCTHESAGKKLGIGGAKIGNAHLKWAFSEAVCLLIRCYPAIKAWQAKKEKKHGKKKTLGIWRRGWDGLCTTCCASARPSMCGAFSDNRRSPAVGCPTYGFLFPVPVVGDALMPSLDYTLLRRQLSLAQVLDLLGFTASWRRGPQVRGPQVRGPCPVHGSTTPHSRSFAAHLDKNCWHCFRCGAGGNALDLYLAVTRLPIYEGALELCARLQLPIPWRRPPRRIRPGLTGPARPPGKPP